MGIPSMPSVSPSVISATHELSKLVDKKRTQDPGLRLTADDVRSVVLAYGLTSDDLIELTCNIWNSFDFHAQHYIAEALELAELEGNIRTAQSTHSHLVSQIRRAERKKEQALAAVSKQRAINRTDSLTGLANRRGFRATFPVVARRAERSRSWSTLCFGDINNFKNFNDTYGHYFGDMVLRTCASIFRNSLRVGLDESFRFGGDELLILSEHPRSRVGQKHQLRTALHSETRAILQKVSSRCERQRRSSSKRVASPISIAFGVVAFRVIRVQRKLRCYCISGAWNGTEICEVSLKRFWVSPRNLARQVTHVADTDMYLAKQIIKASSLTASVSPPEA